MLNELRLFPLVAQRIPTEEADSGFISPQNLWSTVYYPLLAWTTQAIILCALPLTRCFRHSWCTLDLSLSGCKLLRLILKRSPQGANNGSFHNQRHSHILLPSAWLRVVNCCHITAWLTVWVNDKQVDIIKHLLSGLREGELHITFICHTPHKAWSATTLNPRTDETHGTDHGCTTVLQQKTMVLFKWTAQTYGG